MNDDRQRPDDAGQLAHEISEGLGEPRSSAAEYLGDEPSTVDPGDPQVFGRTFIDRVYKILKIGSIYEVQHNQTRLAAEEFIAFFEAAMQRSSEDVFSVAIRDEIGIVNGESLRLKRRAQQRLNDLRDLFASANIRGLLLGRAMTSDDFLRFLDELRLATRAGAGMEHVSIPNIQIEHGPPTRNLVQATMNVDKGTYVLHVYIRGLVKMRNMHEHVRKTQDADVPTGVIRRIMQSVTDLLADEDYTILGLLSMRMVPPDLSTHSFNSAIYAMLLADRLGLSPQMMSYIGMAVIHQDLDRLVGIGVAQRDRETGLDPKAQFSSNLRDVARMLPRVHGDVVSTLRVLLTYERGCAYERPVGAPFYRQTRKLHLISRIVDLCRVYDLLIQGLDGYKTRRPDLAIEYVQSRAGEAFDAPLVELMVSTLGIFPIGTTVQLTSGEKAVVVKTPQPSSDPRRPVVRLLDAARPTVIDLGDPRYAHIEIAGSVDIDPGEVTVSKVFLLS